MLEIQLQEISDEKSDVGRTGMIFYEIGKIDPNLLEQHNGQRDHEEGICKSQWKGV